MKEVQGRKYPARLTFLAEHVTRELQGSRKINIPTTLHMNSPSLRQKTISMLITIKKQEPSSHNIYSATARHLKSHRLDLTTHRFGEARAFRFFVERLFPLRHPNKMGPMPLNNIRDRLHILRRHDRQRKHHAQTHSACDTFKVTSRRHPLGGLHFGPASCSSLQGHVTHDSDSIHQPVSRHSLELTHFRPFRSA